MTNLRLALRDIATTFAVSVYNAVRSASLDELRAGVDADDLRGRSAPAHSASAPRVRAPGGAPPKAAAPATTSDRLPRRSAEEIAKALDAIVGLVKKSREGLRAEEIRTQLGLQSKELPRILKEGIATKRLKTKGQKRATTYFAA